VARECKGNAKNIGGLVEMKVIDVISDSILIENEDGGRCWMSRGHFVSLSPGEIKMNRVGTEFYENHVEKREIGFRLFDRRKRSAAWR
jgi:hypothetical protein